MASLKLKGIDKVYPSGTVALYDVSFETKDREFIVVYGAEQSGKSSLMRAITGLEEVTSGEVFIDGNNVTEADPKDRDVTLVRANSTLSPTMTVYDNMGFGLKLRKVSQSVIDQRVKAAASILGISDVLYRKPKVLNAAQKKRAEIGRAIVREPKLYLWDEPISGLDEKLRAEIINVIINLQARMEGTFIYFTKDLSEALTIGTRIVVLKNGFVQQIDTPSNLYDYPENAYVAFCIGSPTVNFINNARIEKTEEGVFAVEGNIKLPLPENILKRFEKCEEYANTGKSVIVGIRPEDIECTGGNIHSTVTVAEGDYFEVAADGHIFKVKRADVNKGDEVNIKPDLTRLYLFDGETRLTLLARDAGYEDTGYADAEFKPLSYGEEEELKEKFKPKKDKKRR